jgi:hypothetical protein
MPQVAAAVIEGLKSWKTCLDRRTKPDAKNGLVGRITHQLEDLICDFLNLIHRSPSLESQGLNRGQTLIMGESVSRLSQSSI